MPQSYTHRAQLNTVPWVANGRTESYHVSCLTVYGAGPLKAWISANPIAVVLPLLPKRDTTVKRSELVVIPDLPSETTVPDFEMLPTFTVDPSEKVSRPLAMPADVSCLSNIRTVRMG